MKQLVFILACFLALIFVVLVGLAISSIYQYGSSKSTVNEQNKQILQKQKEKEKKEERIQLQNLSQISQPTPIDIIDDTSKGFSATGVAEKEEKEDNAEEIHLKITDLQGGMSNIDGLDGTGTGKMGSGFTRETIQSVPFPDLTTGKPDETEGGLSNMNPPRDRYGFGDDKSTGGPIPGLQDYVIGVVPVMAASVESHAHGEKLYAQENIYNKHSDIKTAYTYWYLEGDNINKPCKFNSDCGNTRCSEAGFCKY